MFKLFFTIHFFLISKTQNYYRLFFREKISFVTYDCIVIDKSRVGCNVQSRCLGVPWYDLVSVYLCISPVSLHTLSPPPPITSLSSFFFALIAIVLVAFVVVDSRTNPREAPHEPRAFLLGAHAKTSTEKCAL